MMNRLLIVLFISTAILSSAVFAQQQSEDFDHNHQALNAARLYTRQLYDRQFNDLYEQFSDDMKNAMPIDSLNEFHSQISQHFGSETLILHESFDLAMTEFDVYKRLAKFSRTPATVLIVWALDSNQTINGFSLTLQPDEAHTDHLEYQTKAELILPFEDEWLVFWGGRSVLDNYHAAHPDQRFAYDFLQSINGKTHSGAGDKNEDYYCFGKAVLAPAKGTIIAIENNIPDNVPGEMNPENPLGNYVIIDHGNDEYSFMSHFKQQSLNVEIGDEVLQAQVIGLCGNSGNSSEAHIHYHLQNTPVFGKGDGLPAIFNNYMHKGNFIESGEPTRGQQVSNHAAH